MTPIADHFSSGGLKDSRPFLAPFVSPQKNKSELVVGEFEEWEF